MSDIDRFSDELADEALKEAASTFFGKRRKLEDDIELFESKVDELKKKADEVKNIISAINKLLLRKQYRDIFWLIPGTKEFAQIEEQEALSRTNIDIPFGLTLFSRYFRLVQELYERTAEKIKVYNHGEYTNHPDIPGKKVASISYSYIARWLDEINANIDKINYYHKSSDVLQFAKRIDVLKMEKEKIAGADFKYDLDEEMKISHLQMDDYNIPEFSDIPQGKDLHGRIKKVCAKAFASNKKEIGGLLKTIKKSDAE